MSRHPLLLALATGLSLLLHLLLLGGTQLPWFRIAPPNDDLLASRPATSVQRVRLMPLPAKAPASPIASGGAGGNADASPASPEAPNDTRPSQLRQSTPTSATVPPDAPAQRVPDATTDTPPAPELEVVAELEAEPAPTFPLQLSAQLEGRLGRHSGTFRQTWRMEGLRYSIDVQAERPVPAMGLSSEGSVHPEGGLTPARSALVIGKRQHSMTEYTPGRITLGGPARRQTHPLPVVPQDLASLPFHLAVTFAGQPQTVFVSSGTALHQVRFTLVAEETLRLPAGTLRTLHLAGEHFHPGLRQMVRAYDVWLAPDFLNFPVKVVGHLLDGTPFDYRLLALDIEGRRVIGPLLSGPAAGPDRPVRSGADPRP